MALARGIAHIGAAARALGLTPDAVRRLERDRRIPDVPRDPQGFRLYTPALIEQIRAALRPTPPRPARTTPRGTTAPPVIRPDIHARFCAVVARAEARVDAAMAQLRRSRPVDHRPWRTTSAARRTRRAYDPLIVRAGDLSDLASALPVQLPASVDDAM